MPTTNGFIMHLIPTTIVDAFAQGEILQGLLISVLLGLPGGRAWRSRPAAISIWRVMEVARHLGRRGR